MFAPRLCLLGSPLVECEGATAALGIDRAQALRAIAEAVGSLRLALANSSSLTRHLIRRDQEALADAGMPLRKSLGARP